MVGALIPAKGLVNLRTLRCLSIYEFFLEEKHFILDRYSSKNKYAVENGDSNLFGLMVSCVSIAHKSLYGKKGKSEKFPS